MDVLIACEESQAVCIEMRKLGHRAFSCDIQPCSGGHPEWHIMGDVLPLINGRCEFKTMDGKLHRIDDMWDLLIAHPPCTYMSKAGARWMYPRKGEISEERMEKAKIAKAFFQIIQNAICPKIAIENPRPMKIIGLPNPTQVIQPYEYGDPYSKETCLWLKGLAPLRPTNVLKDYKPFCPSNTSAHSKGRGGSNGCANNAKKRAKTFPGIARAMAEQWAGRTEE